MKVPFYSIFLDNTTLVSDAPEDEKQILEEEENLMNPFSPVKVEKNIDQKVNETETFTQDNSEESNVDYELEDLLKYYYFLNSFKKFRKEKSLAEQLASLQSNKVLLENRKLDLEKELAELEIVTFCNYSSYFIRKSLMKKLKN